MAAFALASVGAPSSAQSYSHGSQYSRASHIEGDEFLIQRQKRYIEGKLLRVAYGCLGILRTIAYGSLRILRVAYGS